MPRRPQRLRPTLPLLALTLTAATLATGCATTVPASDTTPPDVRLTVIGAGNTFTLTPTSADASRTVTAGPKVTLFAAAIDDQGVKNVEIAGELIVNCQSGDIGQRSFALYRANNPEDPSIGIGDEAVDRRLTTLELDTGSFANYCRNGFTFTNASGSFAARGENFHGGTNSSAAFTITVP